MLSRLACLVSFANGRPKANSEANSTNSAVPPIKDSDIPAATLLGSVVYS